MTSGGPIFRYIGVALAIGVAVHAIFVAYFGQYVRPEYIRAAAFAICGIIVFLTLPLARERRLSGHAGLRQLARLIDAILATNLVYACWNFIVKLDEIEELIAEYSTLDIASSFLAILTLFELTRRTFGAMLATTGLVALLYAVFGQDLPWFFRHSGFDLQEVVEIVWFGFQGVFGFAAGIVILLVFIFIIFGAILEGTGVGDVLIRLSFRLTGRTRGGPAHAAIVASSIFGMTSGSVTANVVGTGAVTIPLIKRRGFSPAFAGAVEAAASSGGQIMPPIMGAAAFLMTQLTGVPYQSIIIAALVPALLYYGSLFVSVEQEAIRTGIEIDPADAGQKLHPGDGMRSLAFFVPLLVIILTLSLGRSPAMAGFWATISAIIAVFILFPAMREKPGRLVAALAKGGIACANILIGVGTIGVIIAVFDLTGLGLKFASQVAELSGDGMFMALLLAAVASLVLGMGMPTLPAYLVIVLVLGTALKNLGIPELSVHMFVFYFGVLSAITPPVAIAAVAAAPIAGADPIRTGLLAQRLALSGFVVPFVFVYEPVILLVVEEFSLLAFLWTLSRLILSIWLINTAFSGIDAVRLGIWQRLARAICAICVLLVYPEAKIAGTVIGIGLVLFSRIIQKKSATNLQASAEEH